MTLYGAWVQDYYNTGTPLLMGMKSYGEFPRLNYVVLSIQTELALNRCSPGPMDGQFGTMTEHAVKQYQNENGLKGDGVVGPLTAHALMQARIALVCNSISVPTAIVGGIVRVESAYDFGAIGYVDHDDRGLAQINSVAHPDVSDEEAYSSSFAVDFVAEYMRAALQHFKDNQCAIAAYNAGYEGAAYWCENKSSNPVLTAYVTNVLKGA